MKAAHYISLLVLFSALITNSCKHRQKEPASHKKQVASKNKPKSAGAASGRTSSSSGNSATTVMKKNLGLSDNEIRANKLYSFIGDWYGAPYKYSGCHKTGVDCSCFTNILYDSVYGKKLSRTASEMYEECDPVSADNAREGYLVFFKINSNRVTHVGVFLRNNYFVHSSVSKGVVINSLNEAYYKKYLFCAGKFRN